MIDSFEFNKIAMAVLGIVFALFGLSLISEVIFHADVPEQPAFVLAEVDGAAESEAEEEDTGPAFAPVTPLMASADAEAGANEFKKCAACHTVDEGGANKVGPNLYGVLGQQVAAHEGFSYSSALVEYGEGKTWDYENLNGFLWKPKTYVKGTAMSFVGIKDVEDRANVIAYLRSLAATPVPLPTPEAEPAAAEEEAAPADEEAAPAEGDAAPAAESEAEAAPADTQSDSETAPAEEAPAESAPADSTDEEAAPAQDEAAPAETTQDEDSEASESSSETAPAPENNADGDDQAN